MKSQIIVIIIAVVLAAAIVHPFTLLVFAAKDNHEELFKLQEKVTPLIHEAESHQGNSLSITELFELQHELNNLSQQSELATSVIAAGDRFQSEVSKIPR